MTKHPATDIGTAATVLAAVHRAARGSTGRWVNVHQSLGDLGFDADQLEQAIELLFRQKLLSVSETPAHSVRLTAEGLEMAAADTGPLLERRPKAR